MKTKNSILAAAMAAMLSVSAISFTAAAQPAAPGQGGPEPKKEARGEVKPCKDASKCCCCCCGNFKPCDKPGEAKGQSPDGPEAGKPGAQDCAKSPCCCCRPEADPKNCEVHKGRFDRRPEMSPEREAAFRAAFIPEKEFKAMGEAQQKEVLAKQKAFIDERDAKAEEAAKQRKKEMKQLKKDWKKFDKLTVEEQQELIKKKMHCRRGGIK